METLSVFRSYEPGEPNCRIYVKNLAKHVQEKVSWNLEIDFLLYFFVPSLLICLFLTKILGP